ncbi:phosphomannomutase [Acidithiobacillus ferridurans]|uniref:phosphomannomutase n=1 Tax=Acidithiobacillus ferridurans TaxID=1232575 RepID=UPI001C06F469|nr:phosphomannomutase [Acidithiobacillus ferridurans]MBU2733151.1 phosphomannomutase [Acidithiobacillus ferridurans]
MVAFGTSGLRGLVVDLSDKVVFVHTQAFLRYLAEIGEFHAGDAVILGGDLRPSTPRMLAAAWSAVLAGGGLPRFAGYLPSPALAFAGLAVGVPSLMVTGSHIPFDRNGIKFNRPHGELMKADEAGILRQDMTVDTALFDAADALRKPAVLPAADPHWLALYQQRYLDFFGTGSLAGWRLGVYQHSGVARDLLVTLLESLGAEVLPLGRSADFVALDTEALRPEDTVLAQRAVAEHHLDALLTTDGDADRPMIADHEGRWWRGDVLGILTAHALGAHTVVTPVSSNTALELSGFFPEILRTRIGSPYVIEAMQAALQEGLMPVCGYEANGGFLLGSPLTRDGRTLAPLPTRDAILPMLTVLAAAQDRGVSLAALLADLPPRHTASDRLQNFPSALSRRHLDTFRGEDKAANLVAFNTAFGEIAGAAQHMDLTDGIRVTLASGGIIHLRPSGNAPELRCYTEADSPEQAETMLRKALEVMNGWRA